MTTPTAVQDSWKAAQIVGGRHFVPVAFTYLAFDDTVDVVLGEETVTHPAAPQPAGHDRLPPLAKGAVR